MSVEPSRGGGGGFLSGGEMLVAAERAVQRMEVVLAATGPQDPLLPAAIAVLSAEIPSIDPDQLDPAGRARVAALLDRLECVRDEVQARRRRVGGRLAAVRAAMGGHGGVALVDRRA